MATIRVVTKYLAIFHGYKSLQFLLKPLQGTYMRKLSAVLFALVIIPASYALELKGIKGVEILAINGKEVKTTFLSEKDNELDAGEHQIVVRYSMQFKNDGQIESRPSIFTLDLQQDTQISVEYLNNKFQAEKKIKAGLTWEVISADKHYKITDSDTLMGKGFMPYSDIEKLIMAYNQEHNIYFANAKTVAVVATASTATVIGAQQTTLQSLYQQASKQDKKAFRLWLLEQDMK